MSLRDMMPWGRRGRDVGAGAIENMKSFIESMERAMEEPWQVTGARLLGGEWTPRIDVTESEKEVVVKATLPGLEKKDIHVSVSEDAVTIRGIKKVSQQGEDSEFSFYRSFSMPATVRPDDVRASFKDSVLSLTLPKAKHSQVRRIQIS